MKNFLTRSVALVALMLVALVASAQSSTTSRQYVRSKIDSWGNCRNVAITKTGGDLAIHGRNGNARKGIPANLAKVLTELHDKNEYIDDVVLTEKGSWVVLYGDNGARWYNIPSDLEEQIRDFNNKNEKITAITLNDGGEWAIVSTKLVAASASSISDLILAGCEDYGLCWTVCMTDDGMVAVYDRGYKFLGEVPQKLKEALRESDIDVYRLKFAGNSWFFANKDGSRYRYKM